MSDKSKIYDYIKRTINPYGKPFEGTAYEFGLKIMDYIENMDDEKENGWIPVSERLPETDDYILLSFANYSIPIVGRCERDKDGNGIFYAGDDLISCLGNDLYVNAWMELPERYREDES